MFPSSSVSMSSHIERTCWGENSLHIFVSILSSSLLEISPSPFRSHTLKEAFTMSASVFMHFSSFLVTLSSPQDSSHVTNSSQLICRLWSVSACIMISSTSLADIVFTTLRNIAATSGRLSTPFLLTSALWNVARKTCMRMSLDIAGMRVIKFDKNLSVVPPCDGSLPLISTPGVNSGSASGHSLRSEMLALDRQMPKKRFEWFSLTKTPSLLWPRRTPSAALQILLGAPA
mmetsp:Transcript_78395/g.196871  ORF Transcript_78395/g.196871 Transcript_78395/m.196871 type:complete len:231 (+) Transcript_78395:157-849(+)